MSEDPEATSPPAPPPEEAQQAPADQSRLYKAAMVAGVTISTIYEMFDAVEKSGGLVHPKGIKAAMILFQSLRHNRARVQTLVMEPLRLECQLQEMREAVNQTKQ